MDLSQKRIFVTGGHGFLGRVVVRQFLEAGADPERVFAPTSSEFDLTQEAEVARAYAELRPNVVVHLAAEAGGIAAMRAHPGRYFYANMAMGLHLVEHARRSGVDKFVQVGTIQAYPKFTPVPFSEDELWNGYPERSHAPFGIAKKALLTMLQAYRDQYDLNGVYLLPVNLYGPGDNFDLDSGHVIPALVRKFVEAANTHAPNVLVWGSGKASREFLHVEDCARGIVAATRDYDDREPVNLGAGFEITIKELTTLISKLTGYRGEVVWDRTRPAGQPRRCVDTSRAAEAFGFESQVTFEEGLRGTIEWWRSQASSGLAA